MFYSKASSPEHGITEGNKVGKTLFGLMTFLQRHFYIRDIYLHIYKTLVHKHHINLQLEVTERYGQDGNKTPCLLVCTVYD